MKKKPYKRKPGEMEIRIKVDGQVIMIAPDEKLLEVARSVNIKTDECEKLTEKAENGRT
jgi:hypothetical protein